MRSEEIVRKLEPWLAMHRRPAWKPVVVDGDGPATASKFCGTPWVDATHPWPECGTCKTPLQLFLQLNLDELPEELSRAFGTGLLQLFYCARKRCHGSGSEPFGDDVSRVRVVRPSGLPSPALAHQQDVGFPSKRIVDWTRITDLPSSCEHDELGLIYTYNFVAGTLRLECPEFGFDVTNRMNDCEAEEIADSESGDKLAGWPAWVQDAYYPNCPRCGRRMELVFQLDSEDHVPFMFGDCGRGQVTQCPEHKEVVAFGWSGS
jgi:uncharacterized protein YwqG